jgi:hypothetical protein
MEWMKRLIALKDRKASSLAMVLVSLSVLIAGVLGANYSVGIKVGDWVRYSATLAGAVPDTYAINYTWIEIEFVNVTGTSITYRVTWHMQNGTETNATSTSDLASTNSAPLIPANSKVGDTVYSGASSTVITDETTRSYAGANRVVLSASVSQYGANMTYYFDKQTGVALEEYLVYSDYTSRLVVTETNIWSPTGLWGLDWWSWATIIAAITIAVTASSLALRRRKRSANMPPKVTPTPSP